jgi:ribosomal protein S27AE
LKNSVWISRSTLKFGKTGVLMGNMCPKCGYERQLTDNAPDYECPKCGVIYKKAVEAQEAKAKAPRPPSVAPKRKVNIRWVVIALVLAMITGTMGYRKFQENQRAVQQALKEKQQKLLLAEQQRIRAEQTEKIRAERLAGLTEIKKLIDRWKDAEVIANASPRIALAGPIATLQAIRRELAALKVDECIDTAKSNVSRYMELKVESFIAFMAKDDVVSNTKSIQATEALRKFNPDISSCVNSSL